MKIKCIHCKTSNYTKNGTRKTINRGIIQRYKCKCSKRFTNDEGFYRMGGSEEKITQALDL